MNIAGKAMVLLEIWWAKHHIHLAPEPEGERSGQEGDGTGQHPLTMAVVGDSMVAGCGVDNQSKGFVPDMAKEFSRILGRPVAWQAYGRLGATMRRVRYRLLPGVVGVPDLLLIIAGSNDIMANRSVEEWKSDLSATLEEAKRLTPNIVVFSSGQLFNSPSLGSHLREVVRGMIEEQTEASKRICQQYGAQYVDMAHEDVHADEGSFYAADQFHPADYGYRYMAERTGEMLRSYLTERFPA